MSDGGADAVTAEEIADFTAGLRNLGIDPSSWKAVAQARLDAGVSKLVDVIPDEDTRAAFVKFTTAVKMNVDNRHTILQKLQEDNPEFVGHVKGLMDRMAENVDIDALKASTGKWLATNEEELSGLKEDLVGLYKDVAASEELAQLKTKSAGVIDKIKKTEQATRLVEHGKELLASEKTKELLDSTAEKASQLGESGEVLDLDGRLSKVMNSSIVKKAIEHGSKLLENKDVQGAIAKGSTYLSENGGEKVSEAIKKSRSIIQQTRNSKTTQKMLKHGAAFLDKHGDSIMQRLETTDVDSVIERGKTVFSDPVERQKFLDQVKDMAMEFLIKQLPSVQIPPIEGIADRLQFGIDNLDLSSFVIHKEDVHMKLGNFARTGNLFEATVTNVSASMRDFNWLFHQHYFPNLLGTGSANADIGEGTIRLTFGLRRVKAEDESVRGGYIPRLVVNNLDIDIKTLELKFFDSKMSGIINLLSRLFKDTIRRRLTETLATQTASQLGRLVGRLNAFATKYIPMLLQYFHIDMSHLPEGSKNTNIVGVDHDPEYGVFFINDGPLGFSLQLHKESPDEPTSAVVLKSSNPRIFEGHYLVAWQGARDKRRSNVVIDETLTAQLQLAKLVGQIKTTRRPITLFFRSDEDSGDGDRSGDVADYVSTPTEFDVTFGEGPLGLLIHKRQDIDQGAVVSGFKRGEDDKPGPAEACGMIAPGQILIAINGKSTLSTSFKKTIKAFMKAPRPITLTLRKHPDFTVIVKEKPADRISCEPLAMRLASLDGLVLVTGFEQLPGQAQQSGLLRTGMYVVAVGGEPVHDGNLAPLIKATPRPMAMTFRDPTSDDDGIVSVTFQKGPIGLLFKKDVDSFGHVLVSGFVKSRGPVERTGQVLVGHVLTHVEGAAVGDSVETAHQLIRDALEASSAKGKDKRKVSLTFRDMDIFLELYPSSQAALQQLQQSGAAAAASP